VRAKVLELIGGLPEYNGPLNARVTGNLDLGDYTVEKIVFESLPKYFVTANLYLPKSAGRHPAVLFPLGHWEQGKPAAQLMAGNLALKGFAVLAYDPMGQGERLQAFDKRLGGSLAGGSVQQHLQAGAQSLLIGENYARYHIWDAKRALDYLVSRPEVDAGRIGCTGCSGGGTITTYISALDDRIKAAAPACYMNSWRMLLSGPTGDAEQTFADFLSSGLDMTDYVELFAPKPWLMASTENDFFTPAGAKIVYEEARRWYELLGVPDRVKWVVGPGPHGTPLMVREAIYDWMLGWLAGGKGSPKEQDVSLQPDFAFRVTKSGQVSAEFGSVETHELIRESYQRRKGTPGGLREFVRQAVAHHAPLETKRGADGEIRIVADEGLEIAARLAMPAGVSKAPATIFAGRAAAFEERAKKLAGAGEAVLWLDPRGTPAPAPRDLAGDWITNARAMAAGKNLASMRAHDILCGVDVLAATPGIDATRITVVASDVAGIWALLAAAADPRIARLELSRTPWSLRAALDSPIARGLYEAAVPGLLLRGDLPDLVKVIGRERVTWRDPVDWMRNVVPLDGYEYTRFGH
jgi:cephalosporin-C deacetylase-like acetyl esterase